MNFLQAKMMFMDDDDVYFVCGVLLVDVVVDDVKDFVLQTVDNGSDDDDDENVHVLL